MEPEKPGWVASLGTLTPGPLNANVIEQSQPTLRMPIHVKPHPNSDVLFEFANRSLVRKISSQLKKYEHDKTSVDLIIGVRRLQRLLKWIDAVTVESEVAIVPDEYVLWFLGNKLLANQRHFDAIYCSVCKQWYSSEETNIVSWNAPKPKGFSRGGERGKYFACPHEHTVYDISRKVS